MAIGCSEGEGAGGGYAFSHAKGGCMAIGCSEGEGAGGGYAFSHAKCGSKIDSILVCCKHQI